MINFKNLDDKELLRFLKDPQYHKDNPLLLEVSSRFEKSLDHQDALENLKENVEEIQSSFQNLEQSYLELVSQILNATN